MSHEKGIEAATEVISAEHAYQLSYDAVSKGIKAYLDASGMVMVPREATDEMMSYAEERIDKAGAYLNWVGMLARSPNPFQTPEESREKK